MQNFTVDTKDSKENGASITFVLFLLLGTYLFYCASRRTSSCLVLLRKAKLFTFNVRHAKNVILHHRYPPRTYKHTFSTVQIGRATRTKHLVGTITCFPTAVRA